MAVPMERASQLLPSVKCSNCNAPVPLTHLGDHVCAPPPPVPAVRVPPSPITPRSASLDFPRPIHSPNSASSLLPQRLQNRVPASGSNPHVHFPRTPNGGSISSLSAIQTSRPYSPVTASPLASSRERERERSTSLLSAPSTPLPPRSSPLSTPPEFRGASPPAPASRSRQPQPDPYGSLHREREPETVIGGSAGLAGVGRRGFAAAARAAMFTLPPPSKDEYPPTPTMQHETEALKSGGTPPLSPASGYSSSYSAGPPSPASLHTEPNLPQIRRSPSPSRYSPPNDSGKDMPPAKVSFFEKHKNKVPSLVNLGGISRNNSAIQAIANTPESPESTSSFTLSNPPISRGSARRRKGSYGTPSTASSVGLAYADSDEEEPIISYHKQDDVVHHAKDLVKSGVTTNRSILRSTTSGSNDSATRIRFPTISDRSPHKDVSDDDDEGSVYSDDDDDPRRRIQSTITTKTDKLALDKPTLDKPGYVSTARRSKTLQTPTSPTHAIPTRSKTTDTRSTEAARESVRRERERERDRTDSRKKPKVCARCEVKIEDGRWVAVDGARVLCERCWKNMYLPKCRRCSKPIEKQAVSSSDGQLKGKYHRECFNCYTCHKPFPDKTFYVFDGKPLCAYHYHKSNNSLCRAPTCGEPIEGPCAVSHAGDRYHPEHLTCDSPSCKEPLKEYYEVDGKMLCEKHANVATRGNDDDEEDEDDFDTDRIIPQRRNTRAKKRITQFIDLSGGLR